MNECVWSICGMLLTGKTGVLGRKYYIVLVVGEWMCMEHLWNGTDRETRSTGTKACHSATFLIKISYGLAWDRSTTSTVRGRRVKSTYITRAHKFPVPSSQRTHIEPITKPKLVGRNNCLSPASYKTHRKSNCLYTTPTMVHHSLTLYFCNLSIVWYLNKAWLIRSRLCFNLEARKAAELVDSLSKASPVSENSLSRESTNLGAFHSWRSKHSRIRNVLLS